MIRATLKNKVGHSVLAAVVPVLALMLVIMLTVPAAASSRVNAYGAIGFPTPHFGAPGLDLGIEAQLSKKFYLQFMINMLMGAESSDYRNTGGYPYDLYGAPYWGAGGVNTGLGSGNLLYGISSYGVYKFPVSKRMKLWVKGGVHFSFYDNFEPNEDGYMRRNDAHGLGTGLGVGLEHNFSGRFGVVGGILHKVVWVKTSGQDQLDENISWFKLYTGIIIRISGKP